jgi:putative polysaccharide biosynthesis protein
VAGCIVQPRLRNHPAIADLSNGALSTVRLVTIVNERGEFEPIYAVLRMAVGANTVVDNFHAGGIAAKVDMGTGTLGRATDVGLRPEIGWRDRHPDTGAQITGRALPLWDDTRTLAARGHAAFADRLLIGWDIAITADGPVLIEGNSGPDLDIVQRVCAEPVGNARLGALIALHLRRALEPSNQPILDGSDLIGSDVRRAAGSSTGTRT